MPLPPAPKSPYTLRSFRSHVQKGLPPSPVSSSLPGLCCTARCLTPASSHWHFQLLHLRIPPLHSAPWRASAEPSSLGFLSPRTEFRQALDLAAVSFLHQVPSYSGIVCSKGIAFLSHFETFMRNQLIIQMKVYPWTFYSFHWSFFFLLTPYSLGNYRIWSLLFSC